MKTVSIEYTSAGIGLLMPAENGEQVSATIPAGCVLRRSADAQSWVDVVSAVPFTHTGPMAHYRIDCVTYTSPVTATLEIG